MDFLSALPPHLANVILEKIPIRDAVRTSILSRYWRYAWTKISCLVFDRWMQLYTHPRPYPCHKETSRLISVINQILLQHTGTNIDHFYCFLETSPNIDLWIRFLSIRSIKELLLDIHADDDDDDDYGYNKSRRDRYLLPSSLFACVELTRLELSFCILRPPPAQASDTWFPKLRVLRLWRLAFSGDRVAELLIAGCPFLEELTLRDFQGISGLKIRAPRLSYVSIAGELEWVCFENAPHAVQVSLFLSFNGDLGRTNSCRQMQHPNLEEALGRLQAVERLRLGMSLQFLAAGYLPKQLPIFYSHLKNVELHMNFEDLKEILAALCLLRSSPNLEKLCIMPSSTTFFTKHATDFWQEQENLDCVLHRLRTVKFKVIYGKKVEMDFMKFVLANSPVLQKLVIKTYTTCMKRRRSILKELRQSQKASAVAKIFHWDA